MGLDDTGDDVGFSVSGLLGIIEIVGSAVFVGSVVALVEGLADGRAVGDDVGSAVFVGVYVGPVGLARLIIIMIMNNVNNSITYQLEC